MSDEKAPAKNEGESADGGGESKLRWVLGWIVGPGLVVGLLFGSGVLVGAHFHESWVTRFFVWIFG